MSASTVYVLSQAIGCDVRRFYAGLDEAPQNEEAPSGNWKTLEMAERLEALPEGQLKDGLKLVIAALSSS